MTSQVNINLAHYLVGHSRLNESALILLQSHLRGAADPVVSGKGTFTYWQIGGGFAQLTSAVDASRLVTALSTVWGQLKLDRLVGRLTMGLSMALDLDSESYAIGSSPASPWINRVIQADRWEHTSAGQLAWLAQADHVILAPAAARALGFSDSSLDRWHCAIGDPHVDVFELPIAQFLTDRGLKQALDPLPPLKLLQRTSQDPDRLFTISPWEFQLLIAALLEDMDYHVDLRPRTRDHGIDIVASKSSDHGEPELRYLVQCKQYQSARVGEPELRDLVGASRILNNSGLMLVTTSSFTAPAKRYARSLEFQLHLRDLSDIRRWLRRYVKLRS